MRKHRRVGKDRDQGLEFRARSCANTAETIEEGTAAMNESGFELVEGSGNVFRDFGDPHADVKQAKAFVAARIIAVLDERELAVREAENIAGVAAADFSHIPNTNLGRFTLDRLMKILAALDGRASGLRSTSIRGGPGRQPVRSPR